MTLNNWQKQNGKVMSSKEIMVDIVVRWGLNLTATRIFGTVKHWPSTSMQGVHAEEPRDDERPTNGLMREGKPAFKVLQVLLSCKPPPTISENQTSGLNSEYIHVGNFLLRQSAASCVSSNSLQHSIQHSFTQCDTTTIVQRTLSTIIHLRQ